MMTSGLEKRAGEVLTTGLILPASTWSQPALKHLLLDWLLHSQVHKCNFTLKNNLLI